MEEVGFTAFPRICSFRQVKYVKTTTPMNSTIFMIQGDTKCKSILAKFEEVVNVCFFNHRILFL